ncbi:glycosyltransferase family 87 protein [Asticcacaulis benevestitus]|uniref:glycosyltransferase family 87 protein n=1 Tax=Asticcacaulis benevestitus TaxID=347481 RepID=UPI00039BB6D0|nr:glycosyltransferase family 87 protein [Asticcacaulis benevestitus]
MALSNHLSQIRDADWLNARSARLYALIAFVLIGILPIVTRLVTGDGLIDRFGVPFGGDYISFYTASKLALAGHAADAWRPELHKAAQDTVFDRQLNGYWAFFYPPAYLLVCLPLALLTYGWSVVVAMATTTLAAVKLLHLWMKRMMPDITGVWLPLMAFPGLWMNIACGQNAALTAAIMTGGCLLLQRAPVLSGLVFGLLVIKPQLAIAIPFVLAADGRWKTFFAAAFSAAALSLAAFFVVGQEGYMAFFADSHLARETLDKGLVETSAMQSAFAGLKLIGLPNGVAYAGHALIALTGLTWSVFIIRRYRPDALSLGALLVSVTLLLSPFLVNYDLMLLALPLAWLIVQGAHQRFRPWEKMVCVGLYLLPALARGLTDMTHIPVGALMVGAMFMLVQSRITKTADIEMPAVLKPAI